MFPEGIEPPIPYAAALRHPMIDLIEPFWVEAVHAALSIAADPHQPAFEQHAQVPRHGRPRNRKAGGDIAGGEVASGEDLDNF